MIHYTLHNSLLLLNLMSVTTCPTMHIVSSIMMANEAGIIGIKLTVIDIKQINVGSGQ